ncbi:cytochrome P450 734A6-like, partial [Phalaenopsis equestris]|uniref:cytochrome P450 734A6-like n=1 Tax=Phalaenopsis equestris TaxID=78828 RepID=UPI0009E560B5
MSLLASIFVLLSVSVLLKALHALLWLPQQIQLHFRRQGISGPNRRLLSGGNAGDIRRMFAAVQSSPKQGISHDVAGRAAPHCAQWSALYGRKFLYWFGTQPRLAIGDPTVVRAAMTDTSGTIDKPAFVAGSRELFGEGLVGLTGEKWARHRRIVGPAFSLERVKSWIPEISIRAANMLNKWETRGGENSQFEIDVHKECHNFSADVISCVAFGSNYEEGKRIFELQEELLPLVSLALRSVYIPGFRFVPTAMNRKRWRLNKEIQDSLQRLIENNAEKCEDTKNLPAFSLERVKSWIPEISIRAANMLNKWETRGGENSQFEIDVHKECHNFSADVISCVAFGSNYEEG